MGKRFDFKNKNVVITGGSRGLGLSLAWNALSRGANVMLLARDHEELERGAAQLRKEFAGEKYSDAQVMTQVCDVTNRDEWTACLDSCIHEMGGIDLLVNNAGSILVGPFASMTMEDFEAQMKLHLFAVIEGVRHVVPHFKSRGGGRILNICSLGGKVAVPHMLPYDVSKFALAGFSQGVTPELALENILVTTAYPTVMRTGSPIQAVFKGDHEREYEWFAAIDHLPFLSMSADRAAKKILDAVSTGRSEITLSVPAKIRLVLGALFPETMNAVMVLAARALPTTNSTERKTGADSSARFDRSPIMTLLKSSVVKARKTYNQKRGHDAEFNMGL